MKRETLKVRNDFESTSQQIQRLEVNKTSLEKSQEVMKEEKRGLENALERSKSNLLEAEKELRRVRLDLDSERETNNIVQAENKNLSDDVTEKIAELHASERKRTDQEKELLDLRPLKGKLATFEESIQEIVTKKMKADQEIARLNQ